MPESVWEKGRLEQVFLGVGRRENGEARYRRANFDVLRWTKPGGSNEELYIVPHGVGGRISGGELNLQEEQLGIEFGYYDLEKHVIDPVLADGRRDNWLALHYFGHV